MSEPSPDRRRRVLISAAVAGAVALAAGLAIGLSEGDDAKPVANPLGTPTEPFTITPGEPVDSSELPGAPGVPSPDNGSAPNDLQEPGVAEGPSGPPPASEDERAAARAVRDYVNALTDRDGAAVCAAFEPGVLDEADFPRERGDCAATVNASLGFEQQGMPVWRSSKTTPSISAKLTGDDARVTATVVTLYADQREPTIEDDVVFLRRSGERWLIVKPSATLYRAIGTADVPLSAFTAP
jgi:hypothetical protein